MDKIEIKDNEGNTVMKIIDDIVYYLVNGEWKVMTNLKDGENEKG